MSARMMRRALALPAPLMGRPHRQRLPWIEPGARKLCLAHPTGWLAAEPELHSFSDGGGQVHYRRDRGSAVAVGVEGLDPSLLRAWAKDQRSQGVKRCLLFPVAKWELGPLHRAGFKSMKIGEEAELHLPSLAAPTGDLGRMLRAATRAGLRAELQRSLPPEAEALEPIWRRSRRQPGQLGLLVGSDRRRGLFMVVRRGQEVVCWVQLRPGYEGGGYGLDGMVRHPEAPAGAMELAIHNAALFAADQGAEWLSMGAVPLRGVNTERALLGPVCIALRETSLGNRLFNFQGLGRFKAKFSPMWRDVHMGAYGRLNAISLYEGCRLWGLFNRTVARGRPLP